jgi:hypothetical protein
VSKSTVDLVDNEHVTVNAVATLLACAGRSRNHRGRRHDALRRRSLQVAPMREHLGIEFPADTTHALVALYIAPIPRGPLLTC